MLWKLKQKMPQNNIILGLGNLLLGDDGFGCHAAQLLAEGFSFPPSCEVVDGGTQGQLLYGIVTSATRLLIIDAVDFAMTPGTLTLCRGDAIPSWLGQNKLSAHQHSFAEVLALSRLRGSLTPQLMLIGFQPVCLDFGAPLSTQAVQKLPEALNMALACLAEWNIHPQTKTRNPDSAFHIHTDFAPPLHPRP